MTGPDPQALDTSNPQVRLWAENERRLREQRPVPGLVEAAREVVKLGGNVQDAVARCGPDGMWRDAVADLDRLYAALPEGHAMTTDQRGEGRDDATEQLDAELNRLAHYSDALETEIERLRRALKAIAHNDGGWCGEKAREVLHPEPRVTG